MCSTSGPNPFPDGAGGPVLVKTIPTWVEMTLFHLQKINKANLLVMLKTCDRPWFGYTESIGQLLKFLPATTTGTV